MATGDKPLAIVLAGHNGSGKSTLWYDKLADQLKIPLINADRLTLSILPHPIDAKQTLRPWAAKLRDSDERWQKLSQEGVQLFMGLIMDQHMPFGFETVFPTSRSRSTEATNPKRIQSSPCKTLATL
jgi:predicted ABC-type ATPase